MTEEIPYSNREIDGMNNAVLEKMEDAKLELSNKMDIVIEKQTYTNGKVAFLYRWYWMVVGFCACIAVILLPLLWALIQTGKL